MQCFPEAYRAVVQLSLGGSGSALNGLDPCNTRNALEPYHRIYEAVCPKAASHVTIAWWSLPLVCDPAGESLAHEPCIVHCRPTPFKSSLLGARQTL